MHNKIRQFKLIIYKKKKKKKYKINKYTINIIKTIK